MPGKRRLSLSCTSARSSGPGLKEFLASTALTKQKADDSQWENVPYLQKEDVAAKGRRGNTVHLLYVQAPLRAHILFTL